MKTALSVVTLCLLITLGSIPAYTVLVITDEDIIPTTNNEIGSGNGTLDLVLFTESEGGSKNDAGPGGSLFNADDANTDMPSGVNGVSAVESYMTSIGELRDFYELTFPDGQGGSTVNEIVLFVDVNQITGGLDLQLDTLDIYIDYDATYGDDRDYPAGGDISSRDQNETNTSFSGGTLLACLDSAKVLTLNEQGAGYADYIILTGIDPFDQAFQDDTRILFHWESSNHDDGGETIFLSGTYDGNTEIPEPSMIYAISAMLLTFFVRKRVS